ncbi:hypothetical protein QR680_013842 [Steinernema hermaphroditum]|uniref:Uncharacterized protein n=1 Tax=Steinernema hermaphroditum TaxID=289476 RepID=A0AA39I8X9_9BILA|nr:hypothetical protein QR680_013842 [Steinernema hermaphroditum]
MFPPRPNFDCCLWFTCCTAVLCLFTFAVTVGVWAGLTERTIDPIFWMMVGSAVFCIFFTMLFALLSCLEGDNSRVAPYRGDEQPN